LTHLSSIVYLLPSGVPGSTGAPVHISEDAMAPGTRLQELTAQYMQNPRRYFVPLANEYRNAHELDRAIALCREHLPAQPGHMSGHIVLGRAYFEKGDIAAAREVFLTSVSLDSENLIALRHLGDIARLRNEAAEARQWYARVLDADPQNEEIERLIQSLAAPTGPGSAAGPLSTFVPTPLSTTAIPTPQVELSTALFEPTPPGLRAITEPEARIEAVARPAVTPTMPTFDLGSFAEDFSGTERAEPVASAESSPASATTAEGLVGFEFDDLDALATPSIAPKLEAAALSPPAQEAAADLTVHSVEGDTDVTSDESLLTRPAFGALASFASWRTAKERMTPTATPSVPDVPTPPAAAESSLPPESFDATFWEPEAAATAPQFVTETMAALYEQQGFTAQALEVYRALLKRAPLSQSLAAKVAELEALIEPVESSASLEVGIAKAHSGNELDDYQTVVSDLPDAFESSVYFRTSEEIAVDLVVATPAPTDLAPAGAAEFDDWFADAPADLNDAPNVAVEGLLASDDAAIASSARDQADSGLQTRGTARGTGSQPIAHLFDGEPVAGTSDESAADLMTALAEQMVGRLPKEPPTLPVPEVLDLPAVPEGAEAAGSSPLLSFDRFFSGSGAAPRARMDSPAAPVANIPPWPGALQPSPSLSPTFGGVPVIPPGRPVTPATWAAFDQLASVPPATPVSAPSSRAPTPASVPAPVERGTTPTEVVAFDFHVPRERSATPPEPPAPLTQSATTGRSTPIPAPHQPPEPARDDPPRGAPSDFHRWLEGLS
jgi:tetratricopeptide (TPR) repeat protein